MWPRLLLIFVASLASFASTAAQEDPGPTAKELNDRGNLLMSAGRFEEAAVAYQAGIDSRDDVDAWSIRCRYGLASAQLFGGRLLEARANLSRVREGLEEFPQPSLVPFLEETTGIYYSMLHDFDTAARHYEAAMAGRDAASIPPRTRLNYGQAMVWAGHLEQGEDLLNTAMSEYRTRDDAEGISQCLLYLADIACERGEFEEAQDCLAEALDADISDGLWLDLMMRQCNVARWLGDEETVELKYGEAMARSTEWSIDQQIVAHTDFHRIAMSFGAERAREHHEDLSKLIQTSRNQFEKMRGLVATGSYYKTTGQWPMARDCFDTALGIASAFDGPAAARILVDLGVTHLLMGNLARACSLANEALARAEAYDDRPAIVDSLHLVGTIQIQLGEYETARESLVSCVDLSRELSDPHATLRALLALGDCLRRLGQHDAARQGLNESLAVAKRIGDRYGTGRGYARLSELESDQSNHREAERFAAAAIQLFREFRSPEEELELLDEMARVALSRGELEQVRHQLDEMAALLDRPSVQGLSDLELSRRRSVYAAWDAIAQDLTALEAVSAETPEQQQQVLATGLARAANWKAYALQEASRNRRQSESRGLLREMRSELGQWTQDGELPDGLADRFLATAQDSEPTEPGPRTGAPGSASSHLPPLPSGTALLELVERSTVLSAYLVVDGRVTWLDLGAKDDLIASTQAFLTSIRERRPFDEFHTAGTRVYDSLLAPALVKLPATTTALRIVPSHSLAGVPFGAVPVGRQDETSLESPFLALEYLDDQIEISYLPSTASLESQRTEHPERPQRALVLGAPEYSLVDSDLLPRGDGTRSCCMHHESEQRPVFTRLEFARVELQRVAQAFLSESDCPPEQKATLLTSLIDEEELSSITSDWLDVHVGEHATPERLNRSLLDYSLLYIAAHGIADSDLWGATGIALAATEQDDGFLSIDEVLGMELNRPLVVLSACQTGVGRLLPGEGMQSMAWAFLYAGARGVVASLWNVDDERTWRLLSQFVRHRIRDGQSPAEALRNAAIQARRTGGSRGVNVTGETAARGTDRAHPFYWAGFVYVGDPR